MNRSESCSSETAARWASFSWKGIPTKEFNQGTWIWSYTKLEKRGMYKPLTSMQISPVTSSKHRTEETGFSLSSKMNNEEQSTAGTSQGLSQQDRTAQSPPLNQTNQAQRGGARQTLCRRNSLAASSLSLTAAFGPGTFPAPAHTCAHHVQLLPELGEQPQPHTPGILLIKIWDPKVFPKAQCQRWSQAEIRGLKLLILLGWN